MVASALPNLAAKPVQIKEIEIGSVANRLVINENQSSFISVKEIEI